MVLKALGFTASFLAAQGAMAGSHNPLLGRLVVASGHEKVVAYCSICHSTEYIFMNAPVLDAAGWEKAVLKMVQAYGAPIPDDDQKLIISYLSEHYSRKPK